MSVFQALQRVARPAAVAIALALISPVAHAQQPSAGAMAAAKQLVAVTGATALFSPLIAGVVEQAKLLYLQQDPSLAKDINEIALNMRKELEPRHSELNDEVARLYASRFTEQELKDILAFYQSSAGKKLLNQQPQIIDNSMKFAQEWANKLSDLVMPKMRDELKKKGHNL